MNLDLIKAWEILVTNFPIFLNGIVNTVLYALVGTIVGLLIGLVFGVIKASAISPFDSKGVKILKKVSQFLIGLYIWFFRGTPMMVQALFLYYGLSPIIGWDGPTAGLFVISINTGAYMVEIIRSGLSSIDKGQNEACMALGLSRFQSLIYVILPQAIKNSFPSLGNQLIVNIKDSSMLSVVWVVDLFFQTGAIANTNYRYVETYFVSALFYLALTTIATFFLNAMEKKLDIKDGSKDYCA